MESKHLAGDLAIMQSLPLHIKIEMTEYRIRQWYENYGGDVYVSFSGGKDSTVLLDMARSIYPEIPAVFVDTGLEFPEIKQFVKTWGNVTILRPDISFRKVLQQYGYPVISKRIAHAIDIAKRHPQGKTAKAIRRDLGKYDMRKWLYLLDADFSISDRCCDVMKKAPAYTYQKQTGRKPILATLAEESNSRKDKWIQYGCNAFNMKHPRSAPMSFWTEQDVLCYIHDKKLPIASVYGQIAKDDKGRFYTTGETRTGCIFCMFGATHCERGEGRFERLKRTHPKLWEYCMRDYDAGGLGLRHVCKVCGIRTGDKIEDDGQTTIEDFLNEK